MSDNILKLIPTSPECVPSDAALQQARALIASLFPGANEIDLKATAEVRFVDQGENWERVLCPVCGNELDPGWWRKAMHTAHRTGFTDLSVKLPCCGAVSSLNDLHYEWPAGFARFVIKVYNPGADIADRDLRLLEKSLGCELRKIWAHY